jgi:hypothetical protein
MRYTVGTGEKSLCSLITLAFAPAHAGAFARMEKVQRGEITGYVSLHTLAELYSNLTGKLGASLGIGIPDALRMIEADILALFHIVPLTREDYLTVLQDAAGMGVKNGTIYDGIIGFAAWKQGVDHLITLNKNISINSILPKPAELLNLNSQPNRIPLKLR